MEVHVLNIMKNKSKKSKAFFYNTMSELQRNTIGCLNDNNKPLLVVGTK